MMDNLLCLNWENHQSSFATQLSILRKKNTYTDVTLACEGKLYNLHKVVLSACSDYFSDIFENISCPNPVIILKDISPSSLESLLDYMYLGKVSVRQTDLSCLIQTAECLKLKGLAVPESEPIGNSSGIKRSSDSCPISSKKKKTNLIKDCSPSLKDDPVVDNNSTIDKKLSVNIPYTPITDNEIIIKEESTYVEDYTNPCDFTKMNDDPIPFIDTSQHSTDQGESVDQPSPFSSNSFDNDRLNMEAFNIANQTSFASSSQQMGSNSFDNENSNMEAFNIDNQTSFASSSQQLGCVKEITLPVFGLFIQPYLDGSENNESAVKVMRSRLIDELIDHLNKENLITSSTRIRQSWDYRKLQSKMLNQYPDMLQEKGKSKTHGKGPLGLLMSTLAARRRRRYLRSFSCVSYNSTPE